MRALFCSLAFPFLACATAQKMPASEAFQAAERVSTPPIGSPAWAHQFRRAFDCEATARLSKPDSEVAWHALKACVQRGDFTHLEESVMHWAPELRNRTEAPQLLAQVIAARGGFAVEDVRFLMSKQLPVYSLETALMQPQAFRGQWVLFVAQVERLEHHHKLMLAELRKTSTLTSVFTPGAPDSQRRPQSRWEQRRIDVDQGSAEHHTTRGTLEVRVDDGFVPTGNVVATSLKKPDFSLTPFMPVVFLARFEGVTETPVVNLVAHYAVQ